MMRTLIVFLCLVLSSLVNGATWSPSPSHHHQRVVIEFTEEPDGNTKVSISEDSGIAAGARELFGKCRNNLASVMRKTKNMVSGKSREIISKSHHLEEEAKEVKVKLSEKVKTVGEKVMEVARNLKTAVGSTVGTFAIGDSAEGTLKDSVDKMENWDPIDSPKRIGEDIERNASRKVEQGVEEVKETVKETSLNDLITRSTGKVRVLSNKMQTAMSWCYLLGFSTAYGMGVWVTFFSRCVLGKCLPKQQFRMLVNKLYMVYFRAMAVCVGTALSGYLVSRGKKMFHLSNKMEMFQGFNLLSAFLMNLTNLMFLEPRATKLIVERKKIKEESRTKSVIAEKLRKLTTYSSTLNVSTMVVLTWHLAYIGQLLQARSNP